MFIIFFFSLVLGLLLVTLIKAQSVRNKINLKECILITISLFGVWIWGTTELLSLWNLLSGKSLIWIYVVGNILLGVFFWYKKSVLIEVINTIKLRSFTKFQKRIIYISSIILFLILLTSLLSPPNNVDSLIYHLPRVMHWNQQGSINHYPTHVYRQLLMPTFVEFTFLHTYILSGNDYFFNLIQWFALLGCVIGVMGIVGLISTNNNDQFLAAPIVITIPMAILQASNTKNDLVLAVFMVSTIYFILKLIKYKQLKWGIWVAIPAALAIFTKSTAYLYILTVFVCLLTSFALKHFVKSLVVGVMVVATVIAVNFGHFKRTYDTYGSFIGPKELRKGYTNEKMNASTLISNLTRNMSIHGAAVPSWKWSRKVQIVVKMLHDKLSLDVNDPKTSFTKYHIPVTRDEDYAGNFLHSAFLVLSIFLLFKFVPIRSNILVYLIWLAAALSFILFSLYLKWQPWHSRLQISFFMIGAIPITIAISRLSITFRNLIIGLFVLGSLPYILVNPTRPYLYTGKSIFFTPRKDMYFAKMNESSRADYEKAIDFVIQRKPKKIGLILGTIDCEYLFWSLYNTQSPTTASFYHVGIKPSLIASPKKLIDKFPDIPKPDIIISTRGDRHQKAAPYGNFGEGAYNRVAKFGNINVFAPD